MNIFFNVENNQVIAGYSHWSYAGYSHWSYDIIAVFFTGLRKKKSRPGHMYNRCTYFYVSILLRFKVVLRDTIVSSIGPKPVQIRSMLKHRGIQFLDTRTGEVLNKPWSSLQRAGAKRTQTFLKLTNHFSDDFRCFWIWWVA